MFHSHSEKRRWWVYEQHTQIARFMGPTWGPPGAGRTQEGPMLAPWILLSEINTRWSLIQVSCLNSNTHSALCTHIASYNLCIIYSVIPRIRLEWTLYRELQWIAIHILKHSRYMALLGWNYIFLNSGLKILTILSKIKHHKVSFTRNTHFPGQVLTHFQFSSRLRIL